MPEKPLKSMCGMFNVNICYNLSMGELYIPAMQKTENEGCHCAGTFTTLQHVSDHFTPCRRSENSCYLIIFKHPAYGLYAVGPPY